MERKRQRREMGKFCVRHDTLRNQTCGPSIVLDSPVNRVRSPKKSTRFRPLLFSSSRTCGSFESFVSTGISVIHTISGLSRRRT